MDKADLDALLEKIDEFLGKQGVSIHQRPIQAAVEFSKRTGIFHPLFSGFRLNRSEPMYPERISEWYQAKYGDRLKVNMSPGCALIVIRREPWKAIFPRIYGRVLINLSQCIEKLPQEVLVSLTREEIEAIKATFLPRIKIAYELEAQTDVPYFKEAMRDVASGVNNICSAPQQLAMAKWTFSQAAEKAIKGFIAFKGERARHHHRLKEHANQAEKLGLHEVSASLLDSLHCPGGASVLCG